MNSPQWPQCLSGSLGPGHPGTRSTFIPRDPMPTVASTAVGSFPIGFRQLGGWSNDLDRLIPFARDNGFASVDITQALPRAQLQRIVDAGLRIGTVDPACSWSDLGSPHAGKRTAAVDATAAWIASVAPLATAIFSVAVVEEESRRRHENFAFVVDGYGRLCQAVAKHGVQVLIE